MARTMNPNVFRQFVVSFGQHRIFAKRETCTELLTLLIYICGHYSIRIFGNLALVTAGSRCLT